MQINLMFKLKPKFVRFHKISIECKTKLVSVRKKGNKLELTQTHVPPCLPQTELAAV